MTEINQARELLSRALQQYSEADDEAKVELALLALHKGLEEAMRAYLESQGFDDAAHLQVKFPDLVNLIRDYTSLFEGDPKLPSLLVSLNTTRVKVAHPGKDKPTPKQISRDASQFAKLICRFWPELFGETSPVSRIPPPSKPRRQTPVISEPLAKPRPIAPKAQRPSSPKFRRFLQCLWKDQTKPRFQKKLFFRRMICIVILLILSRWCKTSAIYTVRWPEPIKYIGVALFLLSVGLFVWGVLTAWKVLRQLRLKGLLIVLGISYVLLISVSLLTSDSSLPFHQEASLTTQRLIVFANRKARDVLHTLARAPEEFRFAYTGHRRPVLLPSMDSSYLTPVPANEPAKVSIALSPEPTVHEPRVARSPTDTPFAPTQTQQQPTILSLHPPDCPHPQARLTVPQVNQLIEDEVQVEGTANIEDFDYYKFECRREDGETEDEWHWIESFSTPVEEGVLGIWDVSPLPAGIYTFRLTVVNREGNYPFAPCDVRVRITHR